MLVGEEVGLKLIEGHGVDHEVLSILRFRFAVGPGQVTTFYISG